MRAELRDEKNQWRVRETEREIDEDREWSSSNNMTTNTSTDINKTSEEN